MSKIKILTVQFDVTGMSDVEIELLTEEVVTTASKADVFNESVREVEVDDV